jgi:hypothetical protein
LVRHDTYVVSAFLKTKLQKLEQPKNGEFRPAVIKSLQTQNFLWVTDDGDKTRVC